MKSAQQKMKKNNEEWNIINRQGSKKGISQNQYL